MANHFYLGFVELTEVVHGHKAVMNMKQHTKKCYDVKLGKSRTGCKRVHTI